MVLGSLLCIYCLKNDFLYILSIMRLPASMGSIYALGTILDLCFLSSVNVTIRYTVAGFKVGQSTGMFPRLHKMRDHMHLYL